MLTYKQTTNKTENKPSFKATFIKVKTGLKTQFNRMLPSKWRHAPLADSPAQETVQKKTLLQLLEEEHAACLPYDALVKKIGELGERAKPNHNRQVELDEKRYSVTLLSSEELSVHLAVQKEFYTLQQAFIDDLFETESRCSRAAHLKIQLAGKLIDSANSLSILGKTGAADQKKPLKAEFDKQYDSAIALLNEAFDIFRRLSILNLLLAYIKEEGVSIKAATINAHVSRIKESGDDMVMPLVSNFEKDELVSSSMSTDSARMFQWDLERAKLKITEAMQQKEEFGRNFETS